MPKVKDKKKKNPVLKAMRTFEQGKQWLCEVNLDPIDRDDWSYTFVVKAPNLEKAIEEYFNKEHGDPKYRGEDFTPSIVEEAKAELYYFSDAKEAGYYVLIVEFEPAEWAEEIAKNAKGVATGVELCNNSVSFCLRDKRNGIEVAVNETYTNIKTEYRNTVSHPKKTLTKENIRTLKKAWQDFLQTVASIGEEKK